MFTACTSLVFGSKHVQFWIICLLLCSITVGIFEVEPQSIHKRLVKPSNRELVNECFFKGDSFVCHVTGAQNIIFYVFAVGRLIKKYGRVCCL